MTLARKVPLAAWIIGAVVAVHAFLFWFLADKHFLPHTRYLPPPTPAVNFGSSGQSRVDPQTGEVTTERLFTVSTRLVTPPPAPHRGSPAASPR